MKSMSTTLISLFVLTTLFLFCPSNMSVQASFSVDQQLIELQTYRNQDHVGIITVTNYSNKPMTINVIPVDYLRDSYGSVETPDAGKTAHSLFPYIFLSSTNIELEPNSSYDLEYVIHVPREVEGSRWFALYFESEPEPFVASETQPNQARFAIQAVIAYRTLILTTVVGTEAPNGAITGLRTVEEPFFGFEVDLANTGNTYYRATGWLDIRNDQGQTVRTIPIDRSFVLPGQTLSIGVFDEHLDLAPGNYLALAVLDFGGDQLVAGQLSFEVK